MRIHALKMEQEGDESVNESDETGITELKVDPQDSTLGIADNLTEKIRIKRCEGFFLERRCCKERPVATHTKKPSKSLNRSLKKVSEKLNEKQLNEEVDELRKKQFFNFFSDFYTKYSIDPEESTGSEVLLKSLFKKYYTTEKGLEKEPYLVSYKCPMTAHKRGCGCKPEPPLDVTHTKPRPVSGTTLMRFKERVTP